MKEKIRKRKKERKNGKKKVEEEIRDVDRSAQCARVHRMQRAVE